MNFMGKFKKIITSEIYLTILTIVGILCGLLCFTNNLLIPLIGCLGVGIIIEVIAIINARSFKGVLIAFFWVIVIASFFAIISKTEYVFKGFQVQREALENGTLSQEYYENNVKEIRIFLILIAIVQIGLGIFFSYKYRDNKFAIGMIPLLMMIVFIFICFVFSINNNIFKFITETPASWHKRDFWGYFWDLLLIGVISIIFHGLCTIELNAFNK